MQVLLRAYPEAGSSGAVVVEARLLSEHLPADASQQLLDEGNAALDRIQIGASWSPQQQPQLLYYQDSTSHSAQELARKAWKVLPTSSAAAASTKRSIASAGGNNSSQKATKKVKLPSASSADGVAAAREGEESLDSTTAAPIPRKKSGANLASGAIFFFCFANVLCHLPSVLRVQILCAHQQLSFLVIQERSRLARRRRHINNLRAQTSDSCW